MSTLLNFTRGGQVQFHGIHMFWQILVKFFRIGSFLFIILTTLFWFLQTSAYERYLFTQWGKARLAQYHLIQAKTLQHRDNQARLHHYSPAQILSIPLIKKQWPLAQARLWQAVKLSSLITFFVALAAAILLVHFGAAKSQLQHSRGASLVPPKKLKRMLRRSGFASRWTLAGVPLPKEAETQHILLCGSPGGGKSVCTLELLDQVRKAGQRAIVYDIKGAFIPHYYREGKDIILNPLDERSPSWNLWQECLSLTDFDAMASAIVPDSAIGTESFWTKAARTLLSISAAQFKKTGHPCMQEFIHHLFCNDLQAVEQLLLGTIGNAMVGKDLEKGTRSVILTLVTYCKSLLYVKDEPKSPPLIIRDWVQNDKDDSWLFISSNQRMADTLKPLISLWLEIAVNALLSLQEDRNRRLWLFFDELASLQSLPSLEPILSRGRGYGACFVGAIQDIHQLRNLYGDKAAEVLISLFGTTLFFSTNNNHSAKWAAEQLGRAEFLETREGFSMGAHQVRDGVTLSNQRRQELVVMDSEIRHLKKREAFMVTAGGWPITKLQFKVKNRSSKHPSIIERDLNAINHQIEKLDKAALERDQELSSPLSNEQKMDLF